MKVHSRELHQQPNQPSSPRGTSPPPDLDAMGQDPGPQPVEVDDPEGAGEQNRQTEGGDQNEQEPEQPPPDGDQPEGDGERDNQEAHDSSRQPPDPPEPPPDPDDPDDPEDPDDPAQVPDPEEQEEEQEEEQKLRKPRRNLRKPSRRSLRKPSRRNLRKPSKRKLRRKMRRENPSKWWSLDLPRGAVKIRNERKRSIWPQSPGSLILFQKMDLYIKEL